MATHPEIQPLRSAGRGEASRTLLVPKCVLLAIDDDDMREVIGNGLREAGHHLISVDDGSELEDYLRLLVERPGKLSKPDVVVAELTMPGTSGLMVMLRQRARGDQTPYVLFTDGYDGLGALDAARSAAAFVLRFPDELGRLLHLLRSSPRA